MFGYGALLDSSLGEKLRTAWYGFSNLVSDVPFYWYLVALAVLILCIKFLIKK